MESLETPNRRMEDRLPLEVYLDTFIEDRQQRAFTVNVSERGLYLATLPGPPLLPRMPIGLAFALPGLPETIWAAGEACRDSVEDYFQLRGVRFIAMARAHSRLLREYLNRMRLRRLFGR